MIKCYLKKILNLHRKTKMNKVKIIAEIGANHNGDMNLAKEMIHAAAENGADFAKFQSWQASKIPPGPWDTPEPFFNFKNKRDFYDKAQLTNEQHYELIEECKKRDINFLTTCFDRERAEFLSGLGMNTIKIASCDSTSNKMIRELADSFETLICSTGMTEMSEITDLDKLLASTKRDYVVMHCVSMYPTPVEKIGLKRFFQIRDALSRGQFGISDHSLGSFFPKFAISHGATWVEKHFTTDRNIPGPDNHMSINPEELREIREFASMHSALGSNATEDVYDEERELRKVIQHRFGDNS